MRNKKARAGTSPLLRYISTCESSARGPPASTCSEIEMHPEADILDLLLVELPVGRIPIEIAHQQLEIPTQHPQALELHAGSHRQVCSPIILLMVLDIEGGDRSDPTPPEGLWAPELHASLGGPRLQV